MILSMERIHHQEENFQRENLSPVQGSHIEEDKNLLKAKEKLDLIKERLNYRYDLPDHRLRHDDPDYYLYMCRNNAILVVALAVEVFINFIKNRGETKESELVQLDEYRHQLLKVVQGKKGEMRTIEDMVKIKGLVKNISDEAQLIYDMQIGMVAVSE